MVDVKPFTCKRGHRTYPFVIHSKKYGIMLRCRICSRESCLAWHYGMTVDEFRHNVDIGLVKYTSVAAERCADCHGTALLANDQPCPYCSPIKRGYKK